MSKIIFYELNEVPLRIFEHFSRIRPNSVISFINKNSNKYETFAEDEGHLSPWITWPTVHRGVTNTYHNIYDFGQNLQHVDIDYPPIWQLLALKNIKVGVFGSLHSYPVPQILNNYKFFIPDTFAAGPKCYPEKFTDFQKFNLSMTELNAKNTTKKINFKDAFNFIKNAPSLGLTFESQVKIAQQLFLEKLDSKKTTRRRTFQAKISFDLFMSSLKKNLPDISFFFTNHVASSMHRYWPALFPLDYKDLDYNDEWINDWKGEIPYAIEEVERELSHLVKFVQKNKKYKLLIVSSMGQAAVQEKIAAKTQVVIVNIKKFMNSLGFIDHTWSKKPAMVPLYMISIKDEYEKKFIDCVNNLRVNSKKIRFEKVSQNLYRIKLSIVNQKSVNIEYFEKSYSPESFGIVNVKLQDAAASNAYHIPEGTLLVYGSESSNKDLNSLSKISTIDIAPSILKNFNLEIPSYMSKDTFNI